jgi:hypothetical protein
MDESPYAMLLPALFVEFLQSTDDYVEKRVQGTYIRILRWIAFVVGASLPAFYVVLLGYRHELIPYELYTTLIDLHSRAPLPVFAEILVTEILLELVYESCIRLPTSAGSTIGLVGGIVLGQALVTTRIVSTPTLIVITFAVLCTYVIHYTMSRVLRLLRLALIVGAGCFGLLGFTLVWMLILTHLASLKSNGIPYLAPISPLHAQDMGDVFWYSGRRRQNKRPASVPNKNPTRGP